jgi:hypothetical protein
MSITRRELLAGAAAATLATRCGGRSVTPAPEATLIPPGPPLPDAERAARIRSGDEHWARRTETSELDAAIAAWQQAAVESDATTLGKLARALYFRGYRAVSSERGPAGKDPLADHRRGAEFGERAALAANPALAAAVAKGAPLEDSLAQADASALPGIFWRAQNLRAVAEAGGFMAVAEISPKLRQAMETCLRVDEAYYHGGAHRYLGTFFARAPSMAGGDMDQSQRHFQKAMTIAPAFLATRVLWAEFYATKREDREGFRRELDFVIHQPDGALPEAIAENRVEKLRARALLARASSLF